MKYKEFDPKHHTFEEGSKTHVLSYDTQGRRCSEKDCEINQERVLKVICQICFVTKSNEEQEEYKRFDYRFGPKPYCDICGQQSIFQMWEAKKK